MTDTDVTPYVFEGVELYPPDHVTVIGSTHMKGGGTTKTTNCMFTAFALVARGFRVRVVSYDREHSAVSWADKGAAGIGLFQRGPAIPWPKGLEVEPADSPEDLMDLVHEFDGDYVIVDGSPADEESVKIVAAVCHVVVLPMEPGTLVLEQAPVTAALVREVEDEQGRTIMLRVLLVRVNRITRVARRTKEVLAESDIETLKTSIGNHTEISEMAHQVPRRLYGWETVVVELLGEDRLKELENHKMVINND